MSSHTVTAKLDPIGYEPCGGCGSYTKLISLKILVNDRETSKDVEIRRCSRCILGSEISTNVAFTNRDHMKKTFKRARKCEARTAEETGGRKSAASGAGLIKGDSRNSSFMFEDKFTESESFRLTRPIITKAMSQAQQSGRTPVIRIHMKNGLTVGVMHWNDLVQFVSEGS